MRMILIAASAWSASAFAFDVPKNAVRELQTCVTETQGATYSANSELLGTIPARTQLSTERFSWKEGEREYVVTRGQRTGDGTADVEIYVVRDVKVVGDREQESLQVTTRSNGGGFQDERKSNESNEYVVQGENKILQSRLADSNPLQIRETINTRGTPTGRVVTTTIEGPYTQRLSDITGQYATILRQVRTCTIDRVGQS